MTLFSSMNDLNPNERWLSNRVTGVVTGLGGAIALALSPVAGATGTVQEHEVLVDALQGVGVTVVLNSPAYCDKDTAGAYSSGQRLLFVCQERATVPYKDNGWTSYDLDTLRHEAHHVVQDCLDGGLGDGLYGNLFNDRAELEEFVTDSLDSDEIDWVISTYAMQGLPEHVILNELEAFAAAKVVDPNTIATTVTKVCATRFKF